MRAKLTQLGAIGAGAAKRGFENVFELPFTLDQVHDVEMWLVSPKPFKMRRGDLNVCSVMRA